MIMAGQDLGGLFLIWLLGCASVIEQCSLSTVTVKAARLHILKQNQSCWF